MSSMPYINVCRLNVYDTIRSLFKSFFRENLCYLDLILLHSKQSRKELGGYISFNAVADRSRVSLEPLHSRYCQPPSNPTLHLLRR